MSSNANKEIEEEKEHFKKIINVFKSYKIDSRERLARAEMYLKKIPLEHQKLLEKHGHFRHLRELESCIEVNYQIISEMIADAESMFENESPEGLGSKIDQGKVRRTAPSDIEKLHSTIKCIVRDWSSEGQEERKQCYGRILDTLEKEFEGNSREDIKVLVPGAGMGRLAWEIAKRGFECQGNEFSLFMLFASNFILNKTKSKNGYTIYPWIHQFTNNFSAADVIRPAVFPDEDPADLPPTSKFSMCAGDFLEVYGTNSEYDGHFDCVVTCFFIDCAHNIVEFIELIHRVLKPGGKWINFGPLLYHYADIPKEPSIEPPYDVVRSVIQDMGFRFDKEETDVFATYNQNERSMLQFHYKCIFFKCTRL